MNESHHKNASYVADNALQIKTVKIQLVFYILLVAIKSLVRRTIGIVAPATRCIFKKIRSRTSVSKSCSHWRKSRGRNWVNAKTIRPVNKNAPRTTRTTGQHLGKHVGQQARILPLRAKYKGVYKTTCKIMRANRWGGPENPPGHCINLYYKRRETNRSTTHMIITHVGAARLWNSRQRKTKSLKMIAPDVISVNIS